MLVAEGMGFEPMSHRKATNRLAGGRTRPTMRSLLALLLTATILTCTSSSFKCSTTLDGSILRCPTLADGGLGYLRVEEVSRKNNEKEPKEQLHLTAFQPQREPSAKVTRGDHCNT